MKLSLQFFEQSFFFIKNDSLATEYAILTTVAKKFSENPQIFSSDSKNHEKKH